jgi:hypothetical protein
MKNKMPMVILKKWRKGRSLLVARYSLLVSATDSPQSTTFT